MKAVLELPASLLRKARIAAEKKGTTIEKLAARGIRLALAEPPSADLPKKLTTAGREAMLALARKHSILGFGDEGALSLHRYDDYFGNRLSDNAVGERRRTPCRPATQPFPLGAEVF